jgi:hypothetical protein
MGAFGSILTPDTDTTSAKLPGIWRINVSRRYRVRQAIVLGMLNVDVMLAGDEREIDEQHSQLVTRRVDLRDRLRRLLAWAWETGRLASSPFLEVRRHSSES